MTRTEIEIKLREILNSLIEVEEVNMSLKLNEVGVDSINLIKMLILVEEAFNIELTDEELISDSYTSLNDMVSFIERKL
ncbi:phosphopantetheine-binding protein [Paenibacillus sp. FSL H3-0457]|uniref:acyl carrier protein n=1 Tax=Paenibacillus sp. FSL H3-0457 TaxID=2921430 RepID=UPI0030ED1FB1